MDIKQIITDYIRRSILTTQGDLVVRGATVPEALVAVALGQVLKSGGVGAKPFWGVPSIGNMNIAVGTFDISATGTPTISGVGFESSIVFFMAWDLAGTIVSCSWGFDDAAFHRTMHIFDDGGSMGQSAIDSMFVRKSMGNDIRASITAMNADGFVLSVTLTGVVTARVTYLAIG